MSKVKKYNAVTKVSVKDAVEAGLKADLVTMQELAGDGAERLVRMYNVLDEDLAWLSTIADNGREAYLREIEAQLKAVVDITKSKAAKAAMKSAAAGYVGAVRLAFSVLKLVV
jgi:hypothetical protein